MPQLIDRRLNPRDKSLGNRQRFLRRTREQIKQAVDKAVRERSIADAAKGGSVSIPDRRHQRTAVPPLERGRRSAAGAARQQEIRLRRRDPAPARRLGRRRRQARLRTPASGEDAFTFALTEAEFLDILFDDLELPDLVKATLKDETAIEFRRAGFSNDGSTPNLNVLRTMRTSMSRRLALRRPSRDGTRRSWKRNSPNCARAPFDVDTLKRAGRSVPRDREDASAFSARSPSSIRSTFVTTGSSPSPCRAPRPSMFCLMDVSASMGEREKDLAKRFFILLHLFLKRKYDKVEIVFIRHTHEASEVDEETFFNGRETGGTVVSSALKKMIEVLEASAIRSRTGTSIARRPPTATIRAATPAPASNCWREKILPLTQYYAYIEIGDRRTTRAAASHVYGKDLWRGYAELAKIRSPISRCGTSRSRRRLSGLPPVVRQVKAEGATHMTIADRRPRRTRRAGVCCSRAPMDLSDRCSRPMTRSRRSRSRISASTCFPIRSR